MGTKWWLSLPLVLVTGCAQFPDLRQALAALSPADQLPQQSRVSQASKGDFSFDWILGGDRSVAPLQVFDNGRQTWLQFAPGSPVPAIFIRTFGVAGSAGAAPEDRLVTASRQHDFMVLDEVPLMLVFRGGHLQASARRSITASPDSADSGHLLSQAMEDPATPVPVPSPVTPRLPLLSEASAAPLPVPQTDVAVTLAGASLEQVLGQGVPVAAGATLPVFSGTGSASSGFEVSPADVTLRQALGRWASASGWHFGPEHWMVDVDIPIIAAASFNLPFVDAVRELVSSTELAQRPLQPCFYSNQVLRVVPYTHACNRVARHEAAS